MNKNRRDFLKTTTAVGAATLVPKISSPSFEQEKALAERLDKVWSAPVLRTEFFKQAVKIASIELLQNGKHYLVRVRSTDGATGAAGPSSSTT